MQTKTLVSTLNYSNFFAVFGAKKKITKAVNRLVNTLWSSIAGAAKQINAWNETRRQRRDLYALSDHMLKDLGITRYQALKEAEKPFWKE